MCKEVLNTILTINSSETLLWWLCNLLSMITMLLRLIGPLLIQGSRIQLIIFVLTVFTAVSRSGAGAGCGGEWFIISSENQPRLPATNYVSDPVEAPTDGHCTAWLSPDLRAMFDDCRPQCANYAHRAVEFTQHQCIFSTFLQSYENYLHILPIFPQKKHFFHFWWITLFWDTLWALSTRKLCK